MKSKAKQTIKQKSPKELEALIAKQRIEIANTQLKRSEEKNSNLIKSLRKELAVMLTTQREYQMLQDLKNQEK